jgi:hypothetical protein
MKNDFTPIAPQFQSYQPLYGVITAAFGFHVLFSSLNSVAKKYYIKFILTVFVATMCNVDLLWAFDASSASCADKLTDFVGELDALLSKRETPINQIRILIIQYFPLKNCNIDKAVDICNRSKYALPIGRWRDQTTFGFRNKSETNNGYIVSFVLRNSSGDSEAVSVKNAIKSL